MADINFNTFIGAGGAGFISTGYGGSIEQPSGVTGDIITIPAVSGRRIRLNSLSVGSAINDQSGISVIVGGREVIPTGVLRRAGSAPAGTFNVGFGVNGIGNIPGITSQPGENIVIRKDTGNTAQAVSYSFEYGM